MPEVRLGSQGLVFSARDWDYGHDPGLERPTRESDLGPKTKLVDYTTTKPAHNTCQITKTNCIKPKENFQN